MERWLTTGKVAKRLGVSLDTVRAMAQRGDLRAIRYGGGWLRFEATDVDALIARAREEMTCR